MHAGVCECEIVRYCNVRSLTTGEHACSCRVVSAALAAALTMMPVAAGHAPALAQDFSITNTEQPATAARRDLMRQLQAWWDVHAYYPRRAAEGGVDGTVKIHLVIQPDGIISAARVVDSSESRSLDAASIKAFEGGFVRPFPAGSPEAGIELSVHYVLAPRGNQTVAAGDRPAASKRPFTITDAPVKSPILETMLQRACAGTIVKEGIRNHASYGGSYAAQAVFFRRPDGTPWVPVLRGRIPNPRSRDRSRQARAMDRPGRARQPWIEVSSRATRCGRAARTALRASWRILYPNHDPDAHEALNHGGTVDLSCAAELVPAIQWSAWSVTPGRTPPGDPP